MVVVGALSYKPEDIIGRGCFATLVYSGLDYLSRPVAIKRMQRAYGKDADIQLREVELMKRAGGHNHILRYIHVEMNHDFL